MKTLTPLQTKLLHLLSDGTCHSGQHLGDTLDISRTAVWKHIEKFEALGLHIKRVPKQGYCISPPFIPLSLDRIQSIINTQLKHPIDYHLFASIDSTNRFLKDKATFKHLTCCIAETQTNGRGRFRRHWHSPFGENIYCSLGLCIEGDLSRLSGLSLVVSLAMHHVLQKHTSESIVIKWPNDLLWNHKKLAGTLIEMVAEGNNSTDVIIGMGLNINSCFNYANDTPKPWCSLHDITGQFFDRNQLIAELILTINIYLQQFKQDGFSGFREAWNAKDYLKNKQFTISGPTGVITGTGCGVNQSGYLLLEDKTGNVHKLSSGDTTLAQEKT